MARQENSDENRSDFSFAAWWIDQHEAARARAQAQEQATNNAMKHQIWRNRTGSVDRHVLAAKPTCDPRWATLWSGSRHNKDKHELDDSRRPSGQR